MAKYIGNKKIEVFKSNNIKNFESINKAAWKLISSIYNSGWNSLITNNHKNSFRQKIITFKFTLRVNPEKNGKKREKNSNKSTSIKRLSPLIPAKSLKEVNKISKYFKSNKITKANTNQAKLYAQAVKTSNNTKEVLKIKEAFPFLQAKNIKNIQRIIKGNDKLKPCINMTTKDPSRKQVIIPMSRNNKKNFIEESNIHISNMNRALKNIKSDILVDFIHTDANGIIIITNKVTASLDLQTIEQYIKGANCINSNEVESSRLPRSKLYLKIIDLPYY